DIGVAAHYGDPYAEQRTLDGAAGLVDRSDRDVLKITGVDRLSWLNSISTQKLDDLAAGDARQSLILSPQGHIEHHLSLVDDGASTWIHTEPGEAASLLEFLESMRFMLRVSAEVVTDDCAVLTVMGPQVAADSLAADARAVATLDFGFGRDLVVDREHLDHAAASLRDHGYWLAGRMAHEALRIAGHRP